MGRSMAPVTHLQLLLAPIGANLPRHAKCCALDTQHHESATLETFVGIYAYPRRHTGDARGIHGSSAIIACGIRSSWNVQMPSVQAALDYQQALVSPVLVSQGPW